MESRYALFGVTPMPFGLHSLLERHIVVVGIGIEIGDLRLGQIIEIGPVHLIGLGIEIALDRDARLLRPAIDQFVDLIEA